MQHFSAELGKLRTGRAHPSMMDGIKDEVYETQTPLNQLATIPTPEAQLIQISPFDQTNIEVICSAIRADQMLGFNPVDNGRVIRIQAPLLTEERRRMIVKQLGEKQEEANISLRKARHDVMGVVDSAKKAKEISEVPGVFSQPHDAFKHEASINGIVVSVMTDHGGLIVSGFPNR